jgi:hypothetical protein
MILRRARKKYIAIVLQAPVPPITIAIVVASSPNNIAIYCNILQYIPMQYIAMY